MINPVNSETELLLLCSRTKIDPGGIERIRTWVENDLDWDFLISVARENKITPLLYWHLQAICPEAVPQIYLEALRDHFHANAKSALYLTKELFRILDLLESYGIQAIPYKGPILASSIYGNLALREFYDLDLLVDEKDALKIKELLEKEGYHRVVRGYSLNKMTPGREAFYLRYGYQYEFMREDAVDLEINWKMVPSYFTTPVLDLDYFRDRLEWATINHKTVRILSPEDLLLVLCLQAAHQLSWTLSLLCDFAELLKAKKEINWGGVIRQASTLGCRRMLFLGILLANHLLDAVLPREVLKEVKDEKNIKELTSRTTKNIRNAVLHTPGLVKTIFFQFKFRERLWEKLRYVVGLALSITAGDLCFIKLPTPFLFLHHFFRPLRLILKYGLGLSVEELKTKFSSTATEIVYAMLEFAEVGPKDIIYNLGCGDGQILIEAAKKYGARGVGVDISPECLTLAKINAEREGVSHLVKFIEKDGRKVDLSAATVLMFRLPLPGSNRFKTVIQRCLKGGKRVVSYDTSIKDCPPSKIKIVVDKRGFIHTLRLWQTNGLNE